MAASELVLGIGCQRGTPVELLARGVDTLLSGHGLSARDVCAIASVEHKRDEPGLHALALQRGWPLTFYPASELGDAVAEPAARRCAESDVLLLPKTVFRDPAYPGSMTLAVAARRPR